MEKCGRQRMKCPFRRMGCKKKWIVRDRMRYHLFWHKENRNDLWMSNTTTTAKDVSDFECCVGNILVEIAKIRSSLNKIDTLNQVTFI